MTPGVCFIMSSVVVNPVKVTVKVNCHIGTSLRSREVESALYNPFVILIHSASTTQKR